jgi:hypothetical protein
VTSAPPKRVAAARFHNRRAAFLWLTALVWDGGAVLLGWIVASEWASEAQHGKALVALGVFGAAGIGLTAWALNAALLTIEVAPGGGLAITRRYPLWLRREVLPASDVQGVAVVEESDGESGSYYVCRIELRAQPPMDVLAKARRDVVEAEAARFSAALGHPAPKSCRLS